MIDERIVIHRKIERHIGPKEPDVKFSYTILTNRQCITI